MRDQLIQIKFIKVNLLSDAEFSKAGNQPIQRLPVLLIHLERIHPERPLFAAMIP